MATDDPTVGLRVDFRDSQTATMVELLVRAAPSGGSPMSLAEAASQAGLTPPVPGQDPGVQIAPTERAPGDVLVADERQYLFLGEVGYFDVEARKLVAATEVPTNGVGGSWFRIPSNLVHI